MAAGRLTAGQRAFGRRRTARISTISPRWARSVSLRMRSPGMSRDCSSLLDRVNTHSLSAALCANNTGVGK